MKKIIYAIAISSLLLSSTAPTWAEGEGEQQEMLEGEEQGEVDGGDVTQKEDEPDYSIKRYPGQMEFAQKYRNINFQDLGGHWARQVVHATGALGMVKGTGGGRYVPNGTLTKEEALIMIVRLLGREEEAQRRGLDLIGNRDTGGYDVIDSYNYTVQGIIAEAESLGIVVQEDLVNINPISTGQRTEIEASVQRQMERYRDLGLRSDQLDNIEQSLRENVERQYTWQRPATREVVAYWLARAITDTDGIAGSSQQAIYTFSDWKNINGRYLQYVEELVQRGIMVGDNRNMFNPKSRITRAEMAQIVYNSHEDVLKSQGYLIEGGKIENIAIENGYEKTEAVRRRVIKIRTEDNDIIEVYGQVPKNFTDRQPKNEYRKGIVTYTNGNLGDQQLLREGMYVKYYILPSGEVALIRQLFNQPTRVDGKLIARYENMILIEDAEGRVHRNRLSNRVDFKVNGVWNELTSLVPEMRGSFYILNGKVHEINVTVQEGGVGGGGNIAVGDYFHTGTVISTSNNSRAIRVARDRLGQNIETYDLSAYPNLPVYRDGSRVSFTSIKAGDSLRIYFKNLEGDIEKIELQSFRSRTVENIYKGSIENFNRNRNQITIGNPSKINGISNWEALGNSQTIQIGDRADIYVTDANGSTDILISSEAFEDYGNYKQQQAEYIEYALNQGQNVYLYTERLNGSEQITRIVLREVGEYKFTGVIVDVSRGVISIPSNQNIYYNNSTMVLSGGRLIHASSLSKGDTITVYTHSGRNTAAVVMVEGEDVSDYPYKVYSTRLSGVNITRQTIEVSGTGSQKVRGTSVRPFPLETLNLPTDAIIQIVRPGTSPGNTENISVARFLDRYYGDFEHSRVKVITDDAQNVLMMQIYDSELNRVNLNDIRVGRVLSKNLTAAPSQGEQESEEGQMIFGDVEIDNVRTWTGNSWSAGIGKVRLNFAQAIIISDGRVVGLDRVRDGSSVYVIGDVNTGHVLIVR